MQAAATSRGVSPTYQTDQHEISCTIGGNSDAGHVVWKLADFNNPSGSLDGGNIEGILQCLDNNGSHIRLRFDYRRLIQYCVLFFAHLDTLSQGIARCWNHQNRKLSQSGARVFGVSESPKK